MVNVKLGEDENTLNITAGVQSAEIALSSSTFAAVSPMSLSSSINATSHEGQIKIESPKLSSIAAQYTIVLQMGSIIINGPFVFAINDEGLETIRIEPPFVVAA